MQNSRSSSYNVIMFAHNEEANIERTLKQAYAQTDENLANFYVIANGCVDRSVEIINSFIESSGDSRVKLLALDLADKCNAWNHYVHDIAGNVDCHFCVDADVLFSDKCFPLLATHLTEETKQCTDDNLPHVIAGLPLSGRNREFYDRLVKERFCFYGNLYGMSSRYLELLRTSSFRLPIGLNWIDSFLTKAANTDLQFIQENLPNRVIHKEGVGFHTQSLSPFKWDDVQLYKNRIARYELGKLQELHLDRLPASEWPEDMQTINQLILENFGEESQGLSALKRLLVKRRLQRLLTRS